MNYEETFRKMKAMRLLGMHEAFKLSLETNRIAEATVPANPWG